MSSINLGMTKIACEHKETVNDHELLVNPMGESQTVDLRCWLPQNDKIQVIHTFSVGRSCGVLGHAP